MKAIETTANIMSDGKIIPQSHFPAIPPGQYKTVIIIDEHKLERFSSDIAPDDVENIISSLVTAGLIRSPLKAIDSPPDPVSAEDRRRLAEILGSAPGKPLSKIIIEERGIS